MGLTIRITVLPHRQRPDFLSLIQQVAGCLGHAALDSQIGVDALCGKRVRQRGTEGQAGAIQSWEAKPTFHQVLGLSDPPSQRTPPLLLFLPGNLPLYILPPPGSPGKGWGVEVLSPP